MNQQELEELLRQIAPNNTPGRLAFNEDTATVEREEPGAYVGADPVKKKVPVRVLTWTDPGTGMTLVVQANPDGTYTKVSQGVDKKMQGEPATTPAQQAAAAGVSKKVPVEGKPGVYAVTTSKQQSDGSMAEETHYENEAGTRVPTPQANPQVIGGTLNTTSPQYAVVGPDGSVTWAANPNYQNPSPRPLTLPNTRTISWANADGTITTEKNPNYVKPSKIIPNPSDPRKMVNVTEDDNGNPVILPVDDKTTIKPADLPVLQAKFGEISQGLGQLAQDLNRRVRDQEITPEERKTAFEAAHAQAATQVAEINSILENSKAIWSGQVTQRGQSLAETQSRRSFASDAAGRAITTGYNIATSAGPGHGKAIAAGVEALMGMQQKYAQGMGGFRESPEIGLPPALKQARGISLPGYGPAATPGPPGVPSVNPQASQSGPPGVPPEAPGANAIGLGAVGALTAPSGAPPAGPPPAPLLPPPPPVPGQSPVAGMGAALGAAQGYAGEPVAAGGAGVWNPMPTVQGMLGDGSDPAWAEAVRRAAQAHGGLGR
jgi:hypothetical protein